jgi:hypothetical protein
MLTDVSPMEAIRQRQGGPFREVNCCFLDGVSYFFGWSMRTLAYHKKFPCYLIIKFLPSWEAFRGEPGRDRVGCSQ